MTRQPKIPQACQSCPAHDQAHLVELGVDLSDTDFVVALAGNPNTGKSTVFNALTGMRQHTGNWPGKTVTRAEGGFEFGDRRFKLIDLPGTYSLVSVSPDEEIARDFLLFGRPDVTVVMVDASRLERNLNLGLQVLEITPRVVVCLNLMDEAERHGLKVDPERLAHDLGVPVVPTVARFDRGLDRLVQTIYGVAVGEIECSPRRPPSLSGPAERALQRLTQAIQAAYPNLPNARWIALRLLDGDERLGQAVANGRLEQLQTDLAPILEPTHA